jgi:hypothetical protein
MAGLTNYHQILQTMHQIKPLPEIRPFTRKNKKQKETVTKET